VYTFLELSFCLRMPNLLFLAVRYNLSVLSSKCRLVSQLVQNVKLHCKKLINLLNKDLQQKENQ
jgi:hypothetical protein